MQEVLGFSPLGTGLAFAALGVAAVVAGAVGPSLTARAVLTAGLVIQAAGTPVIGLETWELARAGEVDAGIEQAGSPEEAVRLALAAIGH